MNYFDTHVHLSEKAFDECKAQTIENFRAAGVKLCVEVACDLRAIDGAGQLAHDNKEIYTAYGMHPHYAASMTSEHYSALPALMSSEKCVALGEIGLDYHYDFSPRDAQKEVFANQLQIANQLNMPVIFHIREAFGDCMDILSANKNGLRGVMHCFSGSYEIAKRCLDMGLYIAFGGSLTFDNARNLRDVAKRLPLDRLVIETDCPYLSPVPLRGKRNEPANIKYVADMLARIHNTTPENIAEITLKNGKKLFNIQ